MEYGPWSFGRNRLIDWIRLRTSAPVEARRREESTIGIEDDPDGHRWLCAVVPIFHRFALRREVSGLHPVVTTERESCRVVVRPPDPRGRGYDARVSIEEGMVRARVPGISPAFWNRPPEKLTPEIVESALERSFAAWRAESGATSRLRPFRPRRRLG